MKRRTLQPEFIERKFDMPEPKALPELAAPEPPQPTLAASLPAKPVQLTLTGPETAQTIKAAPKKEPQSERRDRRLDESRERLPPRSRASGT